MSKTVAMKDGDFFITPNGQLLELDKELKADQDFCENLLQPYDGELGNEINDISGLNNLGPFASSMNGIIGMKLRECVARLMQAQSLDEALDAEEQISGVGRLIVRNGSKPGDFFYYIEGELASGQTVTGNPVGWYKFTPSIKQAQSPYYDEIVNDPTLRSK